MSCTGNYSDLEKTEYLGGDTPDTVHCIHCRISITNTTSHCIHVLYVYDYNVYKHRKQEPNEFTNNRAIIASTSYS